MSQEWFWGYSGQQGAEGGSCNRGSLAGRLVASGTGGIIKIYPDRIDLLPLLDRKAIDDDEKFDICLNKIDKRYEDMPDLEYLYDQIFILENLGFCIFTSFALLNNREALELMAELFTYKTGLDMDFVRLMEYAGMCRERGVRRRILLII